RVSAVEAVFPSAFSAQGGESDVAPRGGRAWAWARSARRGGRWGRERGPARATTDPTGRRARRKGAGPTAPAQCSRSGKSHAQTRSQASRAGWCNESESAPTTRRPGQKARERERLSGREGRGATLGDRNGDVGHGSVVGSRRFGEQDEQRC